MNIHETDLYLLNNKFTWVITGVAGFIGSNILERLLKLNQNVVGIDNFATGYLKNLDMVKHSVSADNWKNFSFHEIDIQDLEKCISVTKGADYILHQAAIGSVPRSIEDPIYTHLNNVNGFVNILECARINSIKRMIYASSSSVYGDNDNLPKLEDEIGIQLSPYAISKYTNELYASVFNLTYDIELVGLRYFNVFGKRQDPHGAYAAVIPKWIQKMLDNEVVEIYGDGSTSRDFCNVENAVQANILSAISDNISKKKDYVFNVAVGDKTSLNDLFYIIKDVLSSHQISYDADPVYKDFRKGDVKHSQADISNISKHTGYQASVNFYEGIKKTVQWYKENQS